MTIPTHKGVFEYISQIVVPVNLGTWADLSGKTWAETRTWITEPDDIVWLCDPVDLGRKTYFNLKIQCEANNDVTFKIYASETGNYSGEETETIIDPEDTAVPAFYGQYYRLVVIVPARPGVLNTLTSIEATVTTETFSISRSGVDTSTLTGSAASRTLDLGRTVSHIWSLDIKATSTNHTLEWYVTDHPTSNTLIPVINSKTITGPTFKLVGLDNVARDGTIDYEAVVMPEQRRAGNNLILA